MTLEQLYMALMTVCPRVAYRAFPSRVDTPFITYLFTESNDLMADDENYLPVSAVDIELYSAKKDPALESSLEAVLKGLGLTWSKTETWVEDEKLLETIYSVQIVGLADES